MADILVKAASPDKLHHIEHPAVRQHSQIVNSKNSGVFKPSNNASLAESSRNRGAERSRIIEHFDSNFPFELGILAKKNTTHTTPGKLANKTIFSRAEIRRFR